MTELLDVYTVTGSPLGTSERSTVHRDGLWHQVFHCLIVRSTEPARVVLQRRHLSSWSFPGKLELSATGHLEAGEEPRDGVREIREELGIEVDPDDLIPLGVRLLADDNGEGRNRERVHVHLLVDDRPLSAFKPDPDEVDGLVEVAISELLALLGDDGNDATAPTARCLDEVTADGGHGRRDPIRREDLVNPVDGYWIVLLVMAQRLAAGRYPLAI